MNLAAEKIPYLPERLEGLGDIALNLSWRWNRDARTMFRAIDEVLWSLTWHNPVEMLRRVDPARLAQCARDPAFLEMYERVLSQVPSQHSSEGTWFHERYPELIEHPVAYFCAEFGLHNSVPIYSGGLGVLAGDHCKAASDVGVPLVGVGLLYRKGYIDQKIRLDGWQEGSDEAIDITITPLTQVLAPGNGRILASVEAFGRVIHLGAWKIQAGRVPIYLLDSNLEENEPADRELTQKLYGQGLELRLMQEWILGVGGVRVLRALGIEPAAWHANEGHATFMLVERLRELTTNGVPLDQAIREIRARSIFTTHTPVKAGHDFFSAELIEGCTQSHWELLGMDRTSFLQLGKHPEDDHETFHMTAAAIRLSARVNAVSKVHERVTRRMWQGMWPSRPADQIPVTSITNGVHLQSWVHHYLLELLDEHMGDAWPIRVDDPDLWDRVSELDDARFWEVHLRSKTRLLTFIREQARQRWRETWKEAAHLVGAGTLLGAEALTIGFARRFASYKRADLLFRDEERLRKLLTDPWCPVQLIFAGKAHPADDEGKSVLQRVYSFTRDPRFEGRVAFVEDYELHVAHRLVQGVDLWLNLPRVPLEACGTSGMKAALNGVPQLGTLDGWWAEGYNGQNGWAIPLADTADAAEADARDLEQLFDLLEKEIVPLYYRRDERGVPVGWVSVMKEAMRVGGRRFTARRMVESYAERMYVPALRGELNGDAPPDF